MLVLRCLVMTMLFDVFVSAEEFSLEDLKALEVLICGEENICAANGSTTSSMPQTVPEGTTGPPVPFSPIIERPQCCESCSCDSSTCHLENTCCLKALHRLPSVEESLSRFQMSCKLPQLKEDEETNASESVRMFTLCQDNSDAFVRDRCEHPEKYDDLITQVPVVDSSTYLTYQNKYCALCNGVNDNSLVSWTARITCQLIEYQAVNSKSIVKDLRSTTGCNIIFDVPVMSPRLPGYIKPKCIETISTCNVTGLWQLYDASIEAACHAYTTVYGGKYKNVFCLLCNSKDWSSLNMTCTSDPSSYSPPSFSALLVLPTDNNVGVLTTTLCEEWEIYDPFMETCLWIHCKFPKTTDGQLCSDIVESFSGMTYDIFIQLRPLDSTSFNNVSNDDKVTIGESANTAVTEWLTTYIMQTSELLIVTTSVETVGYNLNPEGTSDLDYILVAARLDFFKTVSVSVLDTLLEIHGSNFSFDINNVHNLFAATINHWFINPMFPLNALTKQALTPVIIRTGEFDDIPPVSEEVLTQYHSCPHAILNVEDISLRQEDNKSMYYLPKYHSTFSVEDIYVDNSTVFLCLEKLKPLFEKFESGQTTDKTTQATTAIGIVSLVCVIVSIICAFLTFVSFIFFKGLRTQPGINTMILAFLIIVSQSLFQFGFNSSDSVSSTGCTVLGILIHYSWLLLLVWLNTCTLHMFRVFFKSQPTAASFNTLKTSAVYVVYCATVATIPVAINIIIFSVRHDGSGYGGQFCYVTSSDFHIYILSVPLGVIIITNIILYVIVIISIHRTRHHVRHQSEQKNFISVYARLSVLTGLTWIFGFVFMFTTESLVEYIFVILNASQGVFIFVSFIMNRRIWKLYKTALSKRLRMKDTSSALAYLTKKTDFKSGTKTAMSEPVSPNHSHSGEN